MNIRNVLHRNAIYCVLININRNLLSNTENFNSNTVKCKLVKLLEGFIVLRFYVEVRVCFCIGQEVVD